MLGAGTAGVSSPATAAPKADSDIYFGFNENWHDHEKKIRFAAEGGANTIRAVLPWAAIEPKPGRFKWGRYDRLYSRMLANGARPLWVLADAPCWAREIGEERCHSEGPVGYSASDQMLPYFARFAGYVAQRYPQSVAIESWNEPNLFTFWRPGPSPVRTAWLTAWANAGVDQVNPAIPVILGGLSPTLTTIPGREIAYVEFIRRAYGEVGPGHWDGVAIHPFPSFQRSSDYLDHVRYHLDRVRKALRFSHARHTPIWVTEIGISTRGVRYPYTVRDQADGLVRIHRALSRMDDVQAMIVHRLIDLPRKVKTAESGWGLVRSSGKIKPAYCALAKERGMACEGR